MNKSFPSREDICRAREKCDTLGELYFFNEYDFYDRRCVREFHCREKNWLGINQKTGAKFKSHRQKKSASQCCSATARIAAPGGCSFSGDLLHSWGMTFNSGAIVLVYWVTPSTGRFILLCFYIRI